MRCEYCHRPVSNQASSREQHQWFNVYCLQWQRYLQGGVSWAQAGQYAQTLRDRRCVEYNERNRAPAETEDKSLRETDKKEARAKKDKKKHKTSKEKSAGKEDKKKKKEKKRRAHTPARSPTPVKKHKRRDPPSSSGSERERRGPRVRRTGPKTFEIRMA